MGKPWESHGDHMFGGENPGNTLLYVILKSWAWDIEVYHQHFNQIYFWVSENGG